jgi:hypothetical protein
MGLRGVRLAHCLNSSNANLYMGDYYPVKIAIIRLILPVISAKSTFFFRVSMQPDAKFEARSTK